MLHRILTLQGMYNYDDSIFDGMIVPDGIDKTQLRTTILKYCGSNEVRYPDPTVLKVMIENFFYVNQYMMETLVGSVSQEYNPIENYDRFEDTSRTIDTTEHGTGKVNVVAEDSPDMTSEEKVSAYNSSDYQPNSTTHSSGKNTSTNNSDTESDRSQNNRDVYTAHLHGNIGVTTNQQMLQAEREIAMFSVYKEIALRFEDEITIPVY